MNGKTKTNKNQVNSIINLQEREELVRKANKILDELKSSTWRDLEVGGKFTKNDKLSFISDDMLIVASKDFGMRCVDGNTKAGHRQCGYQICHQGKCVPVLSGYL